MAIVQQGGQITPITSPFAAQQLGQGGVPLPNTPFSPQTGTIVPGFGQGGYTPNSYQYPGGYPGYQSMGGNMGMFPVANQLQGTIVYAKVVNGEPYILDPETGELLPPGYVPEIDNENTFEGWRPGDSWTEGMEKAIAQWNEDVRQGLENALRPAEEKVTNLVTDKMKSTGKDVKSFGNQTGELLHRIAPGEGEYEAPKDAMGVEAQERARQIYDQPMPVMQQQNPRMMQQPSSVQQPIQQRQRAFTRQ